MSVLKTISLLAVFAAGCATAPKTVSERDSLRESADATFTEMVARNHKVQDRARVAYQATGALIGQTLLEGQTCTQEMRGGRR